MRNDYKCEGKKEKKIEKEVGKYYLYQNIRVNYISWIMLSDFKNLNLHSTYDIYLLCFFNLLLFILFNFNGLD